MRETASLKGLVQPVALGGLVTSRAGKTPARNKKAYWDGDVPWVTAKDLKTLRLSSSQETISTLAVDDGAPIAEPGDILILVRGMTLLKDVPIGIVEEPMSFNQDVRCLRPLDSLSSDYLAYVLLASRDRLRACVTQAGHGTGRLDVDQLMSTPVPVPPIQVQQWLVERIKPIEQAISSLGDLITAKREFKRGLMQQLLTGRRRFPEFGPTRSRQRTMLGQFPDAWDVLPLSSLMAEVVRKNVEGEERVLTCSGEHGLVDQQDYFSKLVASESREGYFLLRRGEFAYNRSSMKGYPFGAIKRLDRYDAGALSTLNICFAVREEVWNSDFAVHFFESGLLNRQLGRITRVGSRAHGLLNVTKGDFFDLRVPAPSYEEQLRIAAVLNMLDHEIDTLTSLRSAYDDQKRGLMQKLLTGELAVPASIPSEPEPIHV